jgi:alpha-D-xyloside xylohydrolase
MRALMMDFAQDQRTWDINDEYMFGKSILVAPVTKSSNISKQKSTYLPSGTDWYDFWTNEKCKGGKDINKEVDIDTLPLYVKAGSIIPFGPDVQYATEKKWDELSIAIYPGANANFTLYEDEFDNYNYEKGAYTTIQMKWDDSRHTLTIGKRNGAYPRMLTERSFTIKVINGNTKTVRYNGKSIQVRL